MSEQIENLIRIKLLGEGAFGEVSLYKHKYTSELYAGKLINKLELKKGVLKYLQSEIDILKKLNHPNVIKVKDVIDKKDKLLIFMEYCNGESLSKCLYKYKDKNNSEGFPEEIIQYLMKQIVDAVIYLHDKNIIHRDLKLDNIMVHFDNDNDKNKLNMMKAKIKIIDFGFAKELSPNEIAISVVGTPFYMSPTLIKEACIPTKEENLIGYGKEADIWSLGCICYELLTGKPVFQANSKSEFLEKIKKCKYHLPKTASIEFMSFLSSMLQYEGKNRIKAKDLIKKSFLSKNIHEFSYMKKDKNLSELNKILSQKNNKNYNLPEIKPIPEESINSYNSSNYQNISGINKSYNLGEGYSNINYNKSNSHQIKNNMPLYNSYGPSFNKMHSSDQIKNNNYNYNFNNYNYPNFYKHNSNDNCKINSPFGQYNPGPIYP